MLKTVERYEIDKAQWGKLPDMNQYRKGCSAVCMPDGLYVMGGFDGCQYLKSVEKFDFTMKRWKYIQDMNYSKCFFSAVPSGDYQYIYSFGGYNGKPIEIAERFDIISSKWDMLPKIPSPKYKHQCLYLNE